MTAPGSKLRFTRDHEWARPEDAAVRIGITDHAQEALGDVVYVELPEVGTFVEAGDAFGVVESVKTVSDLFAPCAGEISAINEALADHPELVNSDPYGDGWLVAIKTDSALSELMDPAAYEAFVAAEG